MMETLAELQKLRQQLHDSDKLMEGAESRPGTVAALSYLAADCRKFERYIDLLTKEVLKERPPEGVA
jgi:hypothetical protein